MTLAVVRTTIVAGLTAAVALVAAVASDNGYTAQAEVRRPYLNRHLSFAERAADLISRMTLREKVAQLTTTNAPAIPRLGVQEYGYWSEALHGVEAFAGDPMLGQPNGAVHATSFPTSMSASLTWDSSLIRREASAISDEARGFLDSSLFGRGPNNLGPKAGAYGNLVYFAPTVNMDRDPRWGRADESFGEDPFLTGSIGSAYVEGFQGESAAGRTPGRYLKAVATLKHYALNNVEQNRMGISSNTDEGTIRDYYTRQFRQIIETAHAAGVMSSYNAINGVPAVTDNLTLNVLLRRTFGFDGYVTSDCGAVGTTYRSQNGHDWAPPEWSTNHGNLAARWSRDGTRTSVRGPAGGEAWSLRAGTDLNCIGSNGQVGHPAFWDPFRSLYGEENRIDYVREAIRSKILTEGIIDRDLLAVFTQRMRTGEFDPRGAQPYTRITRRAIESAAHRKLARTVADEALTLLQNNRPRGARFPLLPVKPSDMNNVVVIGDQADKVFLGDYSGTPRDQVSVREGVGRALPHAHVVYDSGHSSTTSTHGPSLQPATRTAIKSANLVVVMVGTDSAVNSEGYDRTTLALPGNYAQLIRQVAAQGNPRIALFVQSAGPVDLRPVRRHVASILFSAANGQRQGSAAADVLFGRVNPSGHLSFTWYAGDKQLAPKGNYSLTADRTGGLGRSYMYFTGTPSYPFGYGKSFTTFRYTDGHVNSGDVGASGVLDVSFRVTNTGRVAGSTVAQVYATPPPALAAEVAPKRLVGFARTRVLRPGASQDMTITVRLVRTLRTWSARLGREVIYPGTWQFHLARSSSDFVQSFPVGITGSIPRKIATVTIAPPVLALRRGATLNLRGRNRWLDGLAPKQSQREGDTIISAVRQDDSFADLAGFGMTFSSDRPDVARVDADGTVRAMAAGVATITVNIGGVAASTPFVVR